MLWCCWSNSSSINDILKFGLWNISFILEFFFEINCLRRIKIIKFDLNLLQSHGFGSFRLLCCVGRFQRIFHSYFGIFKLDYLRLHSLGLILIHNASFFWAFCSIWFCVFKRVFCGLTGSNGDQLHRASIWLMMWRMNSVGWIAIRTKRFLLQFPLKRFLFFIF